MAAAMKKTANAFSAESDLLNIHSEMKSVTGKLDHLINAQEAATKRVLKWAEGKDGKGEDPAVQKFLRSICDIDIERDNVEKRYNDHFKIFVKLWKGILVEKKELNAKLKEFESAQANLKARTKKVNKAEQKEPQHKVVQRMQDLEEAKTKEKDVAAELREKEIEVQQDKHQILRTGYTGLYVACMSRYKEHVFLLDQLRELVNSLPTVVGRDPDQEEFKVEAFNGPFQEAPVWWQGEKLHEELQQIKERHSAEVKRMQKEFASKIAEKDKKLEDLKEKAMRQMQEKLSSVAGEHDSAISQFMQDHEAKLAAVKEAQETMKAEYEATIKLKDEEYATLLAKLENVEADLQGKIKKIAKLQEQIANLKSSAVKEAKREGVAILAQAALSANRTCMEVVVDMAAQAKAAADGLLPVINAEEHANHEHFVTKAQSLVHATSAVFLSGTGAASASRAENSQDIITALDPLKEAATTLLLRLNYEDAESSGSGGAAAKKQTAGTESATSTPSKVAAAGKQLRKVKALYPHEGKVQDGFKLIGFEKDDILSLIKKRADGWSRVKTVSGEEGWAPSSYLQELPQEEEEAETQQEEKEKRPSVSLESSQESPESLVEKYKSILDSVIDTANKIALRDRELAKLSNQVANAIEEKVSAAQQSIMDGMALFQKLLAHTKATETDRLLEVNENLLNTALKLEEGMRNVINAAEGMRAALIRTKGTQSEDDFNAKHESWFEALTVSVDAVVEGNPLLMEAVRSVLGRKGKHEELQVASRSITASVAQLAALSRTKSLVEESAQNLVAKQCSAVIETGNELLGCARESQDLALASVLMEDFTELTANQAKRLTMATQVKVLKLEKDLEREREKLGQLRRLHYHD